MICDFCGKENAEVRLTTESLGKGDNLIIIEDVPIIHCRNCGQRYLTAQTAHEIETIRRNRKAHEKRQVVVARFSPA